MTKNTTYFIENQYLNFLNFFLFRVNHFVQPLLYGSDNFMNKIALFILLIFGTVQLVPGFQSMIEKPEQIALFAPDEEKSTSQQSLDEIKKEKKELSFSLYSAEDLSRKLQAGFSHTVALTTAPYLEQPTPPPNC